MLVGGLERDGRWKQGRRLRLSGEWRPKMQGRGGEEQAMDKGGDGDLSVRMEVGEASDIWGPHGREGRGKIICSVGLERKKENRNSQN